MENLSFSGFHAEGIMVMVQWQVSMHKRGHGEERTQGGRGHNEGEGMGRKRMCREDTGRERTRGR